MRDGAPRRRTTSQCARALPSKCFIPNRPETKTGEITLARIVFLVTGGAVYCSNVAGSKFAASISLKYFTVPTLSSSVASSSQTMMP
jgi:hypothetical protein